MTKQPQHSNLEGIGMLCHTEPSLSLLVGHKINICHVHLCAVNISDIVPNFTVYPTTETVQKYFHA